MARKPWEEQYSPDIVNQVKNRDYSTGGADAIRMSDEDYAKVLNARSMYDSADEAGKAALHDDIERLRSNYNYSAGEDGSQYIKLPEKFTYAAAPEYISQYQDLIDAAYARIANRGPFEYDYTQDPRWQAYKKQYTREGVRSQEDTMGQYAAMTGGIPSSAAVTAASQARDYYNAKMTDKIPELYQAAYDMYLAEDNRDRQNLAQLINLENLGRDAYNTQLGQYNNDRSFGFNVWNAAQDRERQAARDAIADQQWYANYDYNVKHDAQNSAMKRIDSYLAAGGSAANLDPALVQAAGYTPQELAAYENYYAQQAAGKSTGGRYYSSPDEEPDANDVSIYMTLSNAGIKTEGDAYDWLIRNGYGTTQAGKFAKYFAEWLKGQQGEALPVRGAGDDAWESEEYYNSIYNAANDTAGRAGNIGGMSNTDVVRAYAMDALKNSGIAEAQAAIADARNAGLISPAEMSELQIEIARAAR
jgi:hypothetical protein